MKAKFERVLAGDGRLFAVMENWDRRFHAPYHFHPEVELTGIISGYGHRIIGDAIEPFAAGDLVLIGANVPHQYSSAVYPREEGTRAASVVIQFLPGILGPAFLESRDGALLRQLLDRARLGLFFSGPFVEDVISRMRALVLKHGPGRFAMLIELLESLVHSKNTRTLASHGFSPVADERKSSRVSRACEYIQQRYEEDITQAGAAAHVAMSPSAFSRMFRAATGLTFTAFLTGVRISEACRRLLETDDTVSQIAFRCGFNNLSNFNRRFLAARGLTPREYRNASTI